MNAKWIILMTVLFLCSAATTLSDISESLRNDTSELNYQNGFIEPKDDQQNFSLMYYAVDADSLYVKLKRVSGPSPALSLYGTFGAMVLIVSIFIRKTEERQHFPR